MRIDFRIDGEKILGAGAGRGRGVGNCRRAFTPERNGGGQFLKKCSSRVGHFHQKSPCAKVIFWCVGPIVDNSAQRFLKPA